jgi:hypothetical protein
MDLNSYIVVSVMTGCFCVGLILKNLVPSKKINRFIPLIMGVLGVLLNAWLNVWTLTPNTLVEGLVSGLASTGMFELGKNLIKIKEGD